MDAQVALTQLTEISKQVRAAVVFTADGAALASTLDEERASRFRELAARILSVVEETDGAAPVTQVEAATGTGSVFVVREGNAAIAATTLPDPVIGVVMYDLRTCLRSLTAEKEPA
jgi:predicted regulator of Ras-like GTPase activity (Roadblock/LC7/MglB family)